MSQGHYLIFKQSGQRFCIDATDVVEVINLPEFTKVPLSKTYTVGVLNFRGEVVSISDLSMCLNLKKSNQKGRVVIVSHNNFKCGLLVDDIEKMSDLGNFEPPEMFTENIKYLSGILNSKDGLIMLLDTGKLLKSFAG